MIKQFSLSEQPDYSPHILCLGAHSDDIEIGCGGTILKLLKTYPNAKVTWVVFSATGSRIDEAKASAASFLAGAKEKQIVVKDFRDGFFPYTGADIKAFFETLKPGNPDLVFTHFRNDRHQDHRVISDLAWNTFRDHLILEYEIPKYDGDLGTPNFYTHLDKETCQEKVRLLVQHFGTQANKHWFTEETFFASLRLRGIESRAPEHYAEAFYGRKIVLQL
ncbi:MAG: PIG-L deacetylase family protein [Candidatus Promineifilaceae bacterium]|nr:PIG-L family deacetylase [Anaerolineaceae bacterium]